jgi:membrane-associated phospholipid phosphatase
MHPRPFRPARIPRSTVPSILVLVLAPVLLAAGPRPSPAAELQGDPDAPSTKAPFGAGLDAAPRSVLRRDFDRLASSGSLRMLLAGGALALAVRGEESPDRAEQLLDRGYLDGGLDIGSTYGSGLTLGAGALALLAAGKLADDPNLGGAGSEIARSLAYTGIAVTALKMAVGRTRPNGGHWSFPSGHAAAAFATAPVLSRRFGPRVGIPAYALAVATGLGRMEDRKHYLSDVLAGAAIGLTIGHAVAGPDASDGGPSFLVGPAGAGVSITF